MKPKFKFKQVVKCKNGIKGKVIEVTLFRRTNTLGYGIRTINNHLFYVGEEDILDKVV